MAAIATQIFDPPPPPTFESTADIVEIQPGPEPSSPSPPPHHEIHQPSLSPTQPTIMVEDYDSDDDEPLEELDEKDLIEVEWNQLDYLEELESIVREAAEELELKGETLLRDHCKCFRSV